MINLRTVIIGGGPAGMMSAISTAENKNDEVIIVEKMNMLGKKLLITGKGRCNITSSLDMEGFIKNTPGNGMFLYSSYQQFTNKDILAFLKKQGLEVKEERGNRIFPITDKSMDVLECFKKRLKELNVKIYLNESAKQILIKKTETEERVIGVKTDKKINFRKSYINNLMRFLDKGILDVLVPVEINGKERVQPLFLKRHLPMVRKRSERIPTIMRLLMQQSKWNLREKVLQESQFTSGNG